MFCYGYARDCPLVPESVNRLASLLRAAVGLFRLQPAQFAACLMGALLVLGAGLLFMEREQSRESSFVRTSYDWSFDLTTFRRPNIQTAGVVVVYLDAVVKTNKEQEESPARRSLKVGSSKTSRLTLEEKPKNSPEFRLAELIQRGTREGARAMVLDVSLTQDPASLTSADVLAKAIRDNGRVVMLEQPGVRPASRDTEVRDYESLNLFRPSAVGLSHHHKELDFSVRRHCVCSTNGSSGLAMAAAEMLKITDNRPVPKQRWINYYGGPRTIPSIYLSDASQLEAGAFAGKVVFVSLYPGDNDEHRCPQSGLWVPQGVISGLEIHATEFLNLMRGDWLWRLPAWGELMVLLITSAITGFLLVRMRALAATVAACVLVVGFGSAALSLFTDYQLWFPWMVIVAVQIPTGLVWGLTCYSTEQYVQRRHLERERRERERQIREQAALLDKAQDAIIVHDLDWKVSFWNKSAERLYGWTSEEILTRSLVERLVDEEHDSLLEAKSTVLRLGEWTGELKQRKKDGTDVLVQSRWSLVRDEAGEPKSVLMINTDITEKRRLEANFLRAQRMESIGTLAGGIAHDLNNVLSPIVMGVELLQLRNHEENTRKLLNTMSASARRGAEMVKQVLSFARGHNGEHVPLQLSPLVKEMQKILRETFPRSITVETDVPMDLPVVAADATQLHQVLLNLCVNARDAMPDGGKLLIQAMEVCLTPSDCARIGYERQGNCVRLRVQDTGIGIPADIQEKVFEPFFTTKQPGGGTGLGLSTVLSIVKSHGGAIELQSRNGVGTSFDIYLPSMGGNAVVPAIQDNGESVVGGTETVLVVDDEQAILDVTKTVLTDHGYRVLVANHGADAVALCLRTTEPIHLVLMDMMMPIMGGAQAIRTLRELRPHLRFIAMSGLQPGERTRDVGDAVFLGKPFTGEKLLLAVRQALSNRSAETLFYRRALAPRPDREAGESCFTPMKA